MLSVHPYPLSSDEETYRAAQKLFKGSVQFIKSVHHTDHLPPMDYPEVAFVGRSNVGKSSIINALLTRKDIARTSNTPGRTQHLNYFLIDQSFYLVDMPGYGFAQVPKKMKESWQRMMRLYLQGRQNLKRVFLLIDARHGIKKNDDEYMDFLDENAVSYQVIFTKSDKISQGAVKEVLEQSMSRFDHHPAAYPYFFATSSQTLENIDQLRCGIYHALDFDS